MNRRALLLAAGTSCLVSASGPLARAQVRPSFADAAAYSAERAGAALVIARHGVVLAEDYPAGRSTTRWPISAGTRAFAALLAASLVQDELMSLDEPVALTLGDWGAHPSKSIISIRSLLSGASGIAFGRRESRDLQAAIALEPSEPPGVRFQDDIATYVLFTEIARRKLEASRASVDPARYLTERTLLPIGAVPIGWSRTRDGAPLFDTGAEVSARGWAQVGELIRREGVWRARQLADDNTLREAVRGSFAESRAGFGLWIAAPAQGSRASLPIDSDLWRASSPAPADLAMAAGEDGQRLYVAPSAGLVVARLVQPRARTSWSDAEFLSLLWRDL